MEANKTDRDEVKAAFEAALAEDGMEINWAEVQRESEEADREAWADLAERIWNREV